MPRKVVAFAASSSINSINKQLVTFAVSLLNDAQVEVLDLNDFEMPLFSVDREAELGHPELAQKFFALIGDCDGVVISLAEHNGNYSAAYKNLFDWASRIDPKVFQNKPVILLATSPGGRGGKGVLEIALNSMPRYAADIKASLSVPGFYDVFDSEKAVITDPAVLQQLRQTVNRLFD